MLLTVAWRNILRAKRRSIVTATLSIFTTALFIFYVALMDGSYAKIFKDSVEIYPGYINITHKKYRDEPSFEHLINHTSSILSKLNNHPEVAVAATRFETFALFATDENAIGGLFTGVEPTLEPKLSRIAHTIKEGRYLQPNDTQEVIIGVGLAKRLKLSLGETFSMIGTSSDESFTADNLTAVGFFKTGLADFDNSAVFMNKDYFDTLMNSHNLATHIIILPHQTHRSQEVAATLSQHFSHLSDLEVASWHSYLSAIIEAMELDRISGMIFLWIFILIIFFVVMIYAYLAIYARIKEVGIMRAIGTSPAQITGILFLETLVLASISVAIGAVLGGWLSYYYELHPIALSELEEVYQQYGIIEAVLPTDFSWGAVFKGVGFILGLNVLSIVYPVWQIVRIKPIDAVHHL